MPLGASEGDDMAANNFIVLIVDDELVNRIVLRAMLECFGAAVIEAADGVEGLCVLTTTACDMVLTDVHMPNMSGLEMVRRLRVAPGPNNQTTCVAVTADTTIAASVFEDCGLDGFMHKPITAEAVARALGTQRKPTFEVDQAAAA
jgi:CheY-like chemotaxis protein